MTLMNEDSQPQDQALSCCPTCGSACDAEDSYCRRCGAALHASRVPMVPDNRGHAPVAWRQTMPVVARGAAVVAAGTLAEAILRRLISRAFKRSAHPSEKQTQLPAPRGPDNVDMTDPVEPAGGDDHVVSETFLFRRVRLRRRG